ncbi:MAG: hypothetical protein IJB20_06465 [Clostridia bacterium]|nr:hypothetical protein [Clostridia bacterium]
MNKIKLTSLLLTMLMLAAACGGGETAPAADNAGTDAPSAEEVSGDTSSEETVPEETEPEYEPLPAKDMDGFDMCFYNYDDSWLSWVINILDTEETTGDVLNDAVWDRNNRMEETYNCVISQMLDRNPADQLAALVQAGDTSAEVVMIYDEQIVNHYTAGRLLTWDVLPHVNFEHPWWSWSATQTFSSAGKVYAATGDFSLAQSTRSFIMMFNKDMYADLGLKDDLYQLVLDGKWTADRLYAAAETAVLDLNGDGVMNPLDDRFGCATAMKLYYGSLVTGAGIKYVDIDAEGNAYFAIPGNEYALTVMSDIMNKHTGNYIFTKVVSDIHGGSTEGQNMFKNNQTLFLGSSMKAVSNYRDMDSDIGILPFPKYSEEQDAYYALTSGGTMATLPATLAPDSHENVGLLLEAMSRDSRDSVIPVYKETLLKSRYARDEGSAAMLDIIFASAMYDIGLSTIPSETYYKYMEVYNSGTDTFASLTQSISKIVNKKLENLTKQG